MAKTKKKRPAAHKPISQERYQTYLLALLEGQEAARTGQAVYWDLGPGERPRQVCADFQRVARKERLAVRIQMLSKGGRALVFTYMNSSPSQTARVRVIGRDGRVKKELAAE